MKSKLIFTTLLALFIHFSGVSQNIHQLKTALKTAKSDTAKANILNKLVSATQDQESEKYNSQLKKLSENKLKKSPSSKKEYTFYKKHLLFTLNRTGTFYLNEGDYDKAFDLHQRALKIGEEIRDKRGIANSILNLGNFYYFQGDFPKALEHFQKALKIQEGIKDKEGMANSFNRIGVLAIEQGDGEKALKYYRKSLKMQQEIGNQLGIAAALNNIGQVYHHQGDIPKAIDYYHKSLKIKEKIGNKKGIASSLTSIGVVYYDQNDFDKMLDVFERALKLRIELGNKDAIAESLGNIGAAYQKKGDYKKALYYCNRGLKIEEEIGAKTSISTSLNNIGSLYLELGQPLKALDYNKRALKIQEEIGDQDGIAASLTSIGEIYRKQGKLKEALELCNKSFSIATEIGYPERIRDVASSLYKIHKELGNAKEALSNHELYIQLRDTLNSEENQKLSTEMKYRYEYEKKAAEDHVRATEEKKVVSAKFKQEQTQRYALYGGLALVTLFGGFMFNRFRITSKQKKVIEIKEKETQEQNVLISQQKVEVEFQKHLVEDKQKEILDSITYAKRLQEAILPPLSFIDSFVPENFVLYKPKDIVAGDFYWAESLHDLFFIAAADSTGHGVPGAMVSVVCSNALNRSVKEFGLLEPGTILDKTRELVIETFAKNNSEVKDGMDISLLCIDRKNQKITWSGANNPLWYIQSGELTEIKANKQPIGKTENPQPFTTHPILYEPNTLFYLFTDGFADQFGGPKGKKFKHSQFKELLLDIESKPSAEQTEILESQFENWKGGLEQVDDVCVIGVRI